MSLTLISNESAWLRQKCNDLRRLPQASLVCEKTTRQIVHEPAAKAIRQMTPILEMMDLVPNMTTKPKIVLAPRGLNDLAACTLRSGWVANVSEANMHRAKR